MTENDWFVNRLRDDQRVVCYLIRKKRLGNLFAPYMFYVGIVDLKKMPAENQDIAEQAPNLLFWLARSRRRTHFAPDLADLKSFLRIM